MQNFRERIQGHAAEIKKQEEFQASQSGVYTTQDLGARQHFNTLARKLIIPVFEEFKKAMREIDRDAAIVDHISSAPVQSIGITLLERYVRSSVGKTITLVNPKDEISRQPNAKFYEVTNSLEGISVRQKVEADYEPIATIIPSSELTRLFLENELAGFFERAFPKSNPTEA